ncbi:alpha/beta fold hydrolase [Zavarzinia sp. CC-PAN008]|uniref:alpha/beta fold hydrolase n=1 Tax=Zavarzinia sp. CC-PAN008 TaxID=3243332 RepID=UPI003F744C66
MTELRRHNLGRVTLQSGQVLDEAALAFTTYGTLNAAADNAVLLPTFYTGTHVRNQGFFGPGRAIDPARHFVVSINLFGNAQSSSPSNAAPHQRGPAFPNITLHDNVACQHALLTHVMGVKRLALVAGWSMGGCQAYEWGAQFPDFVDAIVPFCGSARTSVHNHVFLMGVKAALEADPAFAGGHYTSPPVAGLDAFGRVYCGWAYSQAFFREHVYRQKGFASADAFLDDWARDHVENWDANDLLAMLWSWDKADISANARHGGDFAKALGAITPRAVLIPCNQDLYFPPEDTALEAAAMPNAQLRPYDSPFGHCVASPGNDPVFQRFLDGCIAEVLG